MCCTSTPNPPHRHMHAALWVGPGPGSCGCGCIGSQQTALHLKHYQEHLKAELKSVEHQINILKEKEK